MIGLWRVNRGKRAAIATVEPLVSFSRHRLGTIPDHVWRRPYIIGYTGSLISYFALHGLHGNARNEQISRIQIAAWMTITRLPDDTIGEEICLLSSQGDSEFREGCKNAAKYIAVHHGLHEAAVSLGDEFAKSSIDEELEILALEPGQHLLFGSGGVYGATLWKRFFDDRIVADFAFGPTINFE